MNSFSVTFWIIIGIYILVGLGLISRVKTMADYYVMGWGATWFWLAGTLLATITSAVTFLGASGQMYIGSIQNNLPIFSGGLFGTAIATFFAARKLRQLKTMTVPEFWQSRYGQTVKVVGTIFMIIQAVTFAMIQLIGAGLLLGEILNLNVTTQLFDK